MATVICYDVDGNTVSVSPGALLFRPAVYGIFIENNQILLVRDAAANLWQPPGAPLAENETPAQVLRQVFRRVMGMTPKLGPMVYVEDQYVLDADRRAWHYALTYYALERTATAVATDATEKAEWFPLDRLERQHMRFGYEAIQAGRLQLKL
jgi:ADP-ribose pyrophosphatase YjhB (NUDIX family)